MLAKWPSWDLRHAVVAIQSVCERGTTRLASAEIGLNVRLKRNSNRGVPRRSGIGFLIAMLAVFATLYLAFDVIGWKWPTENGRTLGLLAFMITMTADLAYRHRKGPKSIKLTVDPKNRGLRRHGQD